MEAEGMGFEPTTPFGAPDFELRRRLLALGKYAAFPEENVRLCPLVSACVRWFGCQMAVKRDRWGFVQWGRIC